MKTFGIWFSLGAGLLLSGFLTIAAIDSLLSSEHSPDFFYELGFFVVTGGIFIGLFAVSVIRILRLPNPEGALLLRGKDLLNYAAYLGISVQHTHDGNGNLLEDELQQRVLEVEKIHRERRAVVVSIAAAIISAVGALAAWYTHLK